jgi:hypothetical protein
LVSRALALGLLVAAGCLDDRDRVAQAVFTCNPASRTADADCGAGHRCYGALASIGFSMCVPACRADDPRSCPDGACTEGGFCLRRCTVGESCPGSLSCVRNGSAAPGTKDGLCLPVAGLCAVKSDCRSPVFDLCSSEVIGASIGGAAIPGGFCGQSGCQSNGAACEPGSSCLRQVLPASFSGAIDVCTLDCVPAADAAGNPLLECMPGFTCLAAAFPQTQTRTCVPGLPGWLCTQSLSCQFGTCSEWTDVAPGFRACAPPCKSDDDCLPYDGSGNPNAVTKFYCRNGGCRALGSVLFADLCLREGDACPFDDAARCRPPPLPPSPPDLGVANSCAGASYLRSSVRPLGAFGGATPLCVRDCSSDADCQRLSAGTHVLHTCADLTGLGVAAHLCLPAMPGLIPCVEKTSCIGDLTCVPLTPGDPTGLCTLRCASDQDCNQDPALGNAFTCALGVCLPRTPSGCPPLTGAAPSLCLSGTLDAASGRCVSPVGWGCDDDSQCRSGQCRNGRCGP